MSFQVEDKRSQLRTITDDVVSAKKHLITVTPDRVDSIGILTKCTPLIDWLKENTKGNVSGRCFLIFLLQLES